METLRNLRILRTIPLLIAFCLVSFPAQAQYSGGSGTAEDPYRIATADDLIALGEEPNDYDKHFILTADIDLDPNLPGRKVFDRAVIAPDTNDTSPVWQFDGAGFTGLFDGNHHTISHLTIRGVSYLGLFGRTDSEASISNLGLEAVDVNGTGDCVGGLAGSNGGHITSSYSTGTVSGNDAVGGLAGDNGSSITASYSTGMVSGMGTLWGGGVGGLVGSNGGTIRASYSAGMVSGMCTLWGGGVGGLVGSNDGTITTSYSTGSVSGETNVGGLVGEILDAGASVSNCYSTGSVSGTFFVGGLVGFNEEAVITSCFWDVETSGQFRSSGGLGLTTVEMMDPQILGLNGLLTNDPNWVLDAGRDYPRLAWEGTPGQVIPEPVIDWLDGQGTEQEPYRIDTADQMILFGRASVLWDKHFVLGADIDLDPDLPGRKIFDRAVIAPSCGWPPFSGVFDGNDHTISHLTISGDSDLGLFGVSGWEATISNLGLEAVDINGTGGCVGGLVGYNRGSSIANCYSTGSVAGNGCVGGLVGSNWGSITDSYSNCIVSGNEDVGGLVGSNVRSITMSYSTGSVNGDMSVGGLVGNNGGSITTSYSSGPVSGIEDAGGLVGHNRGDVTSSYTIGRVTGRSFVGGLVGWNEGDVTSSYSTGRIGGARFVGGLVGYGGGDITSSFWDRNTSGQSTSDGGTGLNTGQMQMASTFLDAGWDFVDETINGTDDIWWIPEGLGYPRLWWEKLYVDDDAPGDPGPGDPLVSDPLEDGSETHPFDTIQEAIDFAPDRLTVLVQPGLYLKPDTDDSIDFLGKNITLRSVDPTDWDVVDSTIIRGSVQFSGTEDPYCTLTGFTIQDRYYGAVYGSHTRATISHCVISGNGPCGATVLNDCDGTISNCLITDNTTFFYCGVYPVIFGCNGLIKNCTIANNISGISSLGNATIENCIIYNNAGPQIIVTPPASVTISYSDVQGGLEGIAGDGNVLWGLGNIDTDPCFVRSGYWVEEPLQLIDGDYHLKSAGWRWNKESKSWTYDHVTSLCIDAGNPGSPLRDELMSVPRDPDNEWAVNVRINMGAYGGTNQASMAPRYLPVVGAPERSGVFDWALLADLNNDRSVNYVDLAGQAEYWLKNASEQPGDLNRDGLVDMRDFAALAVNWRQVAGWLNPE